LFTAFEERSTRAPPTTLPLTSNGYERDLEKRRSDKANRRKRFRELGRNQPSTHRETRRRS
jgi:hypothetical protein